MSSNLPLVCRSCKVLPCMAEGGRKLEINIPPQQIYANSKGEGLIIEGGILSFEYGNCFVINTLSKQASL